MISRITLKSGFHNLKIQSSIFTNDKDFEGYLENESLDLKVKISYPNDTYVEISPLVAPINYDE
jgi:hypothetical protein